MENEMTTAEAARMYALVCAIGRESFDVLRLRGRLQRLYKKAFFAEARGAIAETIAMVDSMGDEIDPEEAGEILDVMERRLGSEGEGLAARLLTESVTVVRDVFTISAREASGRARYNLRLTDNRAIRIMREHDIVWMRGHYQDKLSAQFKEVVDEVMHAGYSRREMATQLADRFGEIVDGDARYWSDLADHTVTKSREIGRITGFEDAGITEVVVRAVMDDRTSAVCRSLNGRVIQVAKLGAQRDRLLAARTREEMKEAAAWLAPLEPETPMPDNVGIPPYHYRCRTTLQAVVRR